MPRLVKSGSLSIEVDFVYVIFPGGCFATSDLLIIFLFFLKVIIYNHVIITKHCQHCYKIIVFFSVNKKSTGQFCVCVCECAKMLETNNIFM